jgi:hypothetical protein
MPARVLAVTTEKDDIIPIRREVIIAEVGGLVDESRVTLGFWSPDLQPEKISAVLGCAPTSSHRRGDPRRRGPSWPQGAWLLRVEGIAPTGPEELVSQLFGRLPNDRAVWEGLVAKYTVRVTFGIFIGAWNRGFDLSPASVKQIAALGVPVGFDIYADGEDEDNK